MADEREGAGGRHRDQRIRFRVPEICCETLIGPAANLMLLEVRSGAACARRLGGVRRMAQHTNNYPKLHNSTWPGVVGKGAPGAEPIIPLDTLLELTANAEVDGVKYDGVDLWLADPHISIESSKDD